MQSRKLKKKQNPQNPTKKNKKQAVEFVLWEEICMGTHAAVQNKYLSELSVMVLSISNDAGENLCAM